MTGMGRSYSMGTDGASSLKLDIYYTDSFRHDTEELRANLLNFSRADDDFDPVCLRGNYWELIKLDLEAAV